MPAAPALQLFLHPAKAALRVALTTFGPISGDKGPGRKAEAGLYRRFRAGWFGRLRVPVEIATPFSDGPILHLRAATGEFRATKADVIGVWPTGPETAARRARLFS